jgi:hypothetical protein
MQKMTKVFPSNLRGKHYGLTNDGTNVMLFRHQYSKVFDTDYRETIMYDHDDVLSLYLDSIPTFRGDALVVGLGFGLLGYNYRSQCNSFLYLDNDVEIIEMVSPYISDCEVQYADAYTYNTEQRFDCIFLDIFHRPVENHNEKLSGLIDRFSKFLKPDGELTYLKVELD